MELGEFEGFFGAMRPRLLRFAARQVDVDTANDVAIEALFIVWKKNPPAPTTEAERRRLEGFAFRVASGLVKNIQRSRRREERLLFVLADELVVNQTDEEDPAEAMFPPQGGQTRHLPAALARLAPKEREVLRYFIEGYGISEIAALLGRRPGTIGMRLRRAKSNLLELLERSNDGDGQGQGEPGGRSERAARE